MLSGDGSSIGVRALYLGARDKKTVSCTADALVVRNVQGQTRRYPLARVSRVVSSSVTDWHGDALMLCLKRGIGISWLDGKGNALGTCYPAQRHYPTAANAIEGLPETEGGYERCCNWLRTRRMDVLVRWGKEYASAIAPAQWEAAKRRWVYGQQVDEHLPAALHGHCWAWVGSQLAAHSLPPMLLGPQAQEIALDLDLCTLLWAEMNLCVGSIANTTETDEPTTAMFERWSARNGAALALHINSLSRAALKVYWAMDTQHGSEGGDV